MAGGPKCVIGIDFGTLSGRAVVVRVEDGAELGSAVHDYANGVIDQTLPTSGARLPAQWALQDPEDWLEVLRTAVPAAVADAGIAPDQVIGIATDFTASTPLPVLADGTPLCRLDDLRDRPHAWPKLWKHHAAQPQADRINALARERGEPWLARYGGLISSEWEFAKALQVLEEDPEVYERMDRWVEGADWIIWQLCGRETRNTCTAGYKAIHQDGGFPDEDYLRALDERFGGFVAEKIGGDLSPLGGRAGGLTAQAAAWTGLPEGIAVAVGNVDAHVTAPAAGAVGPGQMLMIMGTSTCHVMNGDRVVEVPGMCGVVDGGIVPGLWGAKASTSDPNRPTAPTIAASSRGCASSPVASWPPRTRTITPLPSRLSPERSTIGSSKPMSTMQTGLKRCSTTALVARVVDTETKETSSRRAPCGSCASTARSASPRPRDKSQCVVSAFALASTRRSPSRATASVKVPPVSSPILISRLELRVSLRARSVMRLSWTSDASELAVVASAASGSPPYGHAHAKGCAIPPRVEAKDERHPFQHFYLHGLTSR